MAKKSIDVALKLDFCKTYDYLTCRVSFVRINGDDIRRYDEFNSELRHVTAYAQADKDSRGINNSPYFYGYSDNSVEWSTYASSINEEDAREAAKVLARINRKLETLKSDFGSATFGEYILRVANVLGVDRYYRDGHVYPITWARDDVEYKLREFAS